MGRGNSEGMVFTARSPRNLGRCQAFRRANLAPKEVQHGRSNGTDCSGSGIEELRA